MSVASKVETPEEEKGLIFVPRVSQDLKVLLPGLKSEASRRLASSGGDQEKLLQFVDGVHDALELGLVNQVEGALFSREHFKGNAAGSGDHACGFLGGQVAGSDRVESETDEDTQTANAPALFVNLLLSGWGTTLLNGFHAGLWVRTSKL